MTLPVVSPTTPAVTAQAPVAAPAAAKQSPYEKRTARAEALRASLEAEPDPATSESAETEEEAEPSTAAPPAGDPAGATSASADSGTVDAALAKVREERLARIAQVRAKEAEGEAERQRRVQGKQRDGEVEQLRKKLADLEPLSQVFANEEALLSEAERRGMTAEKLVAWMRSRLSDPTAIARQQAKSEADKIREELAAERKAREDLEQRLETQQREAHERVEAQHKAMTFLERTQTSPSTHPLSAALLAKRGAEGFIQFANYAVAQHLPEGYSVEQLHDYVEQFLDETQVGGASPPVALPANGANSGSSRPPPKNGAAQPATTLSNALTAERATVTEETPLHRLPRAERTRRLREQLERE